MDENAVIRVLLVEDDEEDYILVWDMLRDISGENISFSGRPVLKTR
ncbi:MAG: hypothetical protein ACOWYE_11280 [Desulfatiglandales bacterium]